MNTTVSQIPVFCEGMSTGTVCFSPLPTSDGAAFGKCVLNVVELSAKKQVVGAHTFAIVAFMANEKALGNLSVV